ncbi:acetolactate synthase small subunit [Dictyobacter arantiisoli]|uniref:Acetolactate synthase small subunit n=1 Tax=Dictyobacter arantiisoli TaxID=2014874 RepID=A0A5A5TB18_9CHLR|nr:acetolactate synthase small subunit [Dictyobacter arantiisoli]GCF08622.1 hypothetical protein KDI_21860 [Dictyobacter arantiisoli]
MSNSTIATTIRPHHTNAPQGTEKSYTLIVRVVDRPGSVDRVVGVLRRRRSLLQSLTLLPDQQSGVFRITAQVQDAEVVIEHLIEQLRKIIDVTDVYDSATRPSLTRELVLVQVASNGETARSAVAAGQQAGATVVATTAEAVTFELVGSAAQVEQLITALQPYSILEIARSGGVVLSGNVVGK